MAAILGVGMGGTPPLPPFGYYLGCKVVQSDGLGGKVPLARLVGWERMTRQVYVGPLALFDL